MSEEKTAEAKRLVADGWVQLSRKHRMVARVPEGYTAVEALRAVDPEEFRDLQRFMERRARDILLRLRPDHPILAGCHRQLDGETFEAFRQAGGTSP